jgi:undecaprenyl-diphosphatase
LHDYLLSVILGIVEGLTEFLPVSSTAHLRLSEALLHVSGLAPGLTLDNGYWKMYSIVIQLGAILCLPVYFWSRIVKFASTFPRGETGNRNRLTHPFGLTIVAFVVTALPAFLLTKVIGKHLEDLSIIAWALLIGGIIMWIVDAIDAKAEAAGPGAPGRIHTWKMEDMSLGQSVWIGFCQIFSAVFPGTSRSMSTIAAGQIAGMSRAAALEFSFFVSIPTMAAATLYTLYKSLRGKAANPLGVSEIDPHGWIVLAIGFIVSFIVAYASVAWFMAYVRKRGFAPFAVYRIVVGILVLIFAARLT